MRDKNTVLIFAFGDWRKRRIQRERSASNKRDTIDRHINTLFVNKQ